MLLLCKYFFELYCYLHAIFLDTVLFVTEDILSEFTILENLSYNLNKFTCNISDTQNFTFLEFEHTCISSPFFFFFLSTLVTHIQYEVLSQLRLGSFTFTISFFYFYPASSLTPVHVETQYGSSTSQNSIENRIREYIRVYSIRRNKVNNQRQPKNRSEF